jgi:hypothetical protein
VKIQVVKLISGTAKEIIDQFDYTICMGAYDFDMEDFVLDDQFIEHIARKELYYNVNGKYPVSSLFRLRKFFKKGYTIPGTEMIKLGLCINNLKMQTYRDLKVQLQGIDILFLKDLTDQLMDPELVDKPFVFLDFMDMLSSYSDQILDNLFAGE